MNAFASWLREQLQARGMSISELAHRMGVSHTSVAVWTRGDARPSDANVTKLAAVFGMTEAEIHEAMAE